MEQNLDLFAGGDCVADSQVLVCVAAGGGILGQGQIVSLALSKQNVSYIYLNVSYNILLYRYYCRSDDRPAGSTTGGSVEKEEGFDDP